MKISKIINPFYLFSIAYLFILLIYRLNWSELFKPMSLEFTIVILILVMISFVFGKIVELKKYIVYRDLKTFGVTNVLVLKPLIIITGLGIINIYYSGYIPLLIGDIELYESFGIPIIDPLLLSLLIFFGIYWWHAFLSFKKKKYLFYVLYICIIAILMARRSVVTYIFLSNILIYILYIKRISFKNFFLIIILALFFVYFFGYLSSFKSGLDRDYIVVNMGASQNFYDLGIPYEYYNSYLYLCSPMANFYETFNLNSFGNSLSSLFMNEYVPDFLSNKMYNILDIQNDRMGMLKVSDTLNVGTYFIGGLLDFGILGIFLNFLYLILFSFFFMNKIGKNNPYYLTIVGFLCCLFIMSIFSNVFRILINVFVFILPLILKKTNVKKI